jgi:hypothetical protein
MQLNLARIAGGRLRLLCVALAAFVVTACMVKPGRSDVADGKLYEAGQPQYDEFFKALYAVQMTMGRAPERADAVRQGLVKAVDAAPTASDEELAKALDKRLDAASRHGLAVKLPAAELDGPDPGGKLVTTGASSDPADGKAVSDLEQTVKDAAALLTDLRHAKPELERLKEALPELSTRLDAAFADETRRKKLAVKQNLDDAERLIPLMAARGDEVDGRVMDLMRAVEKASPAALPTPPAPPPEAVPKKKEKKPKGDAKASAPKPLDEAKPEAPKESKPEAPKPKPKPADDFEP